jgi:SAM-dependent methyltransferase
MDRAYVAIHLEADRDHWWFLGRLAVILALLRRTLPPGAHRLLELGCGSGNVLEALAEFGEAVGMEADETLAAAAREPGLDVRCGRLPDERVVLAGWPDVGQLLDVLEHLDDVRARMTAAGFTVTYLSDFNTLLLPALVAARGWKRLRGDGRHDLTWPPAALNGAPARVFGLEAALVSHVRMPVGASLLAVARR